MEKGTAVKKISGGKLVRVDACWSHQLEEVKITGDFFLHPEDLISEIENLFTGRQLPLDKEKIVQEIEQLIQLNQGQFIGAGPADLLETLMEAMSCNSD